MPTCDAGGRSIRQDGNIMKQNKIKTGKIIKGYLVFPVIVGIVLAIFAIVSFAMGGEKAGLAATAVFIIYVIAALIFTISNYRSLTDNVMEFIRAYATMENRMIENFPIPYAISDPNGDILLFNARFGNLACDGSSLGGIFKELTAGDLRFPQKEKDIPVVYDKRNYRLHITKLSLEGMIRSSVMVSIPEDMKYVFAVYMIDETETVNMMRVIADSTPVICNIRIDDYEELFDQVEDINKSLVSAHIDKEVSSYFTQVGGLVRKTEKNRYLVIFEHKYLAGMQRNKFDLLDNIRAIDTDSDSPATISVGLGAGKDYKTSQTYAQSALELALGRGGDQVVLKEGERVYFYGGKSKSVEKNSRVKARVTAIAIRDIINAKDNIVIMGHKTADADCFGAAVGMYKIAETLGKRAYIVLNELNNSVQPILEKFLDNTDFAERVFIPVEKAPQYIGHDTALVIVDVNRPEIFECPSLIDKAGTIIMVDHHLQSGDRIDNVALSYVEPSASSACEMITELLQYISGDLKLTKLEAEALYAGILIDTDSFTKNTGVKTFEAAAILKRYGVDPGKVKALFSDSIEDYKIKAKAAGTIEMFAPGFAFAICPSEGSASPTVVAAQVANEMLDVSNIRASFVLVKHNGKVFISARSKENVNVQLIMERMGGGGHLNVAGAQLVGITVEEAVRKLRLTVNKMLEDGVIK